ncbi:MAG: hypothetical protein U0Q16_38830 [Bryobacteraceae bacterium]
MTDQKRVADAIFQAAQQGRFDDARAEAAKLDHPLNRGDVFERVGERLVRVSLGPALWAFEQARDAYAHWASGATSGGEGTARMLDVERVRKKIELAAQNPGQDLALVALRVRCEGKEYGLANVDQLRERLEALAEAGSLPDDLLTSGLDALAWHVSTPLSWVLIEYFRKVGPAHEQYERAVYQRFTQESYSKLCANHPVPAETAPKPRSWEEWSRAGWVANQEDWPLAELVFALDSRAKVNAMLSRLRGGLAPSHETIQYFLLRRMDGEPEADLDRIHALAGLVAASGSPQRELLRDRAALEFREHWRQLPVGKMEAVAAKAAGWLEGKKSELG